MKKQWFYLLIWLCILFILSSDFFSYSATRKLVKDALMFFDPEISIRTVLRIHAFLRKALHVVNYAVLSWFFLCAWTHTFRPISKWTGKIGLLSFLCCVLFSLSDEWRQSLSPIRTPTLFDIVLDASGALLVQLYFMIRVHIRLKKQHLQNP